jgi:hypothetical protein
MNRVFGDTMLRAVCGTERMEEQGRRKLRAGTFIQLNFQKMVTI